MHKTKCVTQVRVALGSMGFNQVWLNQGVENKMFFSILKLRAIAVAQQTWGINE